MSYGHALKTAGHQDEAIAAYRALHRAGTALRRSVVEPGQPQDLPLQRARTSRRCARSSRAAMLAPEHRLHLEFALGKALEDARRIRGVLRTLPRGNAQRVAMIPYYAADNTARVRKAIKRSVHAANSSRNAPAAATTARDPIFIVGLPRAGSTLVEQILSSHSRCRRHDGVARDHRR